MSDNFDNRLFDNLSGSQYDCLAPFFWLHGESRELMRCELDALQKCNIHSVCFESRIHPDFCGETYWADMKFLLEECRKRDIGVWILDDVVCPSGTCNELLKSDEYEKYIPWEIRECHVDIAGPVNDGSIAVSNRLKRDDESILGIVAYKRVPDGSLLTDESVDLSADIHDGMVYFSLGKGVWRIFIFIKTRENVLSICDKLNPEATEFYISKIHMAHYEHLSEYFGNVFKGFFNDEPGFHNNHNRAYITPAGDESAQYPWGECVVKSLEEIYQKDYIKKLVGLWHCFEDGSHEKVRVEYMETISNAFGANYTDKIALWCHNHGIEFIGHILEDANGHAMTGYGCGHFFRALGYMDMSGIDVVLHQIVPGMTRYSNSADSYFRHHNNEFYNYYLAKLGASFGHIDSRKKGRTMCEIFGAYGFAEGLRMMKYIADHMLVRGVNYFVPAAFSPVVDAEFDNPPFLSYGGNNPQFSYVKYLMDYMSRTAYMLSDGIHVSSCAVLYDAYGHWSNGDFVTGEKIAKVLYDNHFDYDILPVEYVEKIDENGFLNGEKYDILIVPYSSYIPDYAKEILNKANIQTVCVGTGGQVMCGFENVCIDDLVTFMSENASPVINCDYEDIYLRSYHYVRNGAHIYMLTNENVSESIHTEAKLCGFEGGWYAVYDAFDNVAHKAFSGDGRITIDLSPYSSVMILWGNVDFDSLSDVPEKEFAGETELDCVFSLSLAKHNSPFEHYTTGDTLFNVTNYDREPRFSGRMCYEMSFDCHKHDSMLLDLGYVGETAEVELNGVPLGVRIAPPYVFEMAQNIRQGENRLKIIVSNHLGYEKRDPLSDYLLYEASGLLGPVKIRNYKFVSGVD